TPPPPRSPDTFAPGGYEPAPPDAVHGPAHTPQASTEQGPRWFRDRHSGGDGEGENSHDGGAHGVGSPPSPPSPRWRSRSSSRDQPGPCDTCPWAPNVTAGSARTNPVDVRSNTH